MSTKVMPKRNEMEERFKWKMEDLYPCDEDWQTEYDEVKQQLESLKGYKGTLSTSSQCICDFMELREVVSKKLERVYVYANQKYHEDTTNSIYQNLTDLAGSLMVMVSSATSFVTPEILSMDEAVVTRFLEENQNLQKYKRFIEDIRRKQVHILSEEMEELLADAGEMAEAAGNIFSMFNNADIKFPEITDENGIKVAISHARFMTFLQSKDRRVRKEAFVGLYGVYKQFKNTLASTFISNIKKEVFYAKARKYPSSLAAALDDGNIPVEVYTNLIQVVNDNLTHMHDYVSLRKKILKVENLHMYDLYTPIVSEVDMDIPFEEAKAMVLTGLEPLGKAYQAILEEGYQNGWIDVYENEGKRSGAYSWGAYGTHPYVLLNYQDNLNNVFTLAHEMGHALHSYYSDKTQPYIYAGYKIFVAEVASTCNEALLMHYLLKETQDKQKRAYLINYYLEQFRTTLFRQTMFAEFEMITHDKIEQGEALTAESLCKIYRELNIKYFGDNIVVDSDIDMEWSRIPHFYNAFYVYQYATGFSAAIALSRKILQDGQSAVDDYINLFLSGGSSKDPIDLLKAAGVDMSAKAPVEEAMKVFAELLDEMEQLMN